MTQRKHTKIWVASFAALTIGLGIGIYSGKDHRTPLPKALSDALTAKRIAMLERLDITDMQSFFSTPEPGLVFVYAAWDESSQRQYKALLPIMETMPTLALAMGDDVASIGMLHATHEKTLPFTPLVVLSRRQLATRAFLHNRSCFLGKTLPFVALTDGQGACRVQWQGFIEAEVVLQTKKALALAPLAKEKRAALQ